MALHHRCMDLDLFGKRRSYGRFEGAATESNGELSRQTTVGDCFVKHWGSHLLYRACDTDHERNRPESSMAVTVGAPKIYAASFEETGQFTGIPYLGFLPFAAAPLA